MSHQNYGPPSAPQGSQTPANGDQYGQYRAPGQPQYGQNPYEQHNPYQQGAGQPPTQPGQTPWQQPPNKPGMPKWAVALIIGIPVLILAAVAVVVAVVLSSDDSSPSTPSHSASSQPPADDETPGEANPPSTSDSEVPVEVGNWHLAVTPPVDIWEEVKAKREDATPPEEGMAYYAINVRGTHSYDYEFDPYFGLQVIYVAEDGTIFNAESCGSLPDDVRQVDEVQPGDQFSGQFCNVAPAEGKGTWYMADFENREDRVEIGSR